ncbi:hypothetical protein PoB_003727000 [Plakobranchus ocellatus]|uniref:Uncharacterized protein n=1 Tax=Plakobranchus ocellatus TaxID=259542 RepID=A0AAV4AR61_9GAST|nr:hypothetical protein PoB_003727000 [Plakobranchus ocellatus]
MFRLGLYGSQRLCGSQDRSGTGGGSPGIGSSAVSHMNGPDQAREQPRPTRFVYSHSARHHTVTSHANKSSEFGERSLDRMKISKCRAKFA